MMVPNDIDSYYDDGQNINTVKKMILETCPKALGDEG